MSVTFSTDHPHLGWRLDCAFQPQVHDTWEATEAALIAHGREVCAPALEWLLANDRYDRAVMHAAETELGLPPDYCEMGVMAAPVYSQRALSVNMSNTNARFVLEALGFDGDEDMGGCMSGNDFLGRLVVAQVLAPADTGAVAITYQGDGGATIVDCGRRDGYLEDMLSRLEELVRRAIDDNVDIHWS